MKDLIFLSVCPEDQQHAWQLRVQCFNFRRMGYSSKYHVLLFREYANTNSINMVIEALKVDFPEVTFHTYTDDKNACGKLMRAFDYIPLLRPWTLQKHFEKYPELKDKAIFYTDQDVIFTRPLSFDKYLNDDINYLSYTGRQDIKYNYLNGDYFDGKIEQVEDKKKDTFLKSDPLAVMCEQNGISKEILYENNQNTGGAQYLLKNIDAHFWSKVLDSCMLIKLSMHNYNQRYMKGETYKQKEDAGYQAWCADMWAVLWNIWATGGKTLCPSELDFVWATDTIDRWDSHYIYHHAGGHEIFHNGELHYLFNKRKLEYVDYTTTPYEDLDDVRKTSDQFCAWYYAQEILNSSF